MHFFQFVIFLFFWNTINILLDVVFWLIAVGKYSWKLMLSYKYNFVHQKSLIGTINTFFTKQNTFSILYPAAQIKMDIVYRKTGFNVIFQDV